MSRIDINNHNIKENRQKFVSSVYTACAELFDSKNMLISISKNTDLKDVGAALHNIAEIIEVGAMMFAKTEEEQDEQDEKKDGYDGWLDPTEQVND